MKTTTKTPKPKSSNPRKPRILKPSVLLKRRYDQIVLELSQTPSIENTPFRTCAIVNSIKIQDIKTPEKLIDILANILHKHEFHTRACEELGIMSEFSSLVHRYMIGNTISTCKYRC